MMRHVDLCSGIGGFALGFEWAGLSKPVLFCDIEPWSRKIVPIAEDVKELANDSDGLIPDCDILTAGYPCQPFSLAGERRGTEDDRHIWPYILSIVQTKRPSWCVFENVYGHVSMGLDEVLSDLEGQSYAARPFIVPACAADAPHRRDRVWIIARNVGDTRRTSIKARRDTKTRKEAIWGAATSDHKRSSQDVADTDSARQQQGYEEVARQSPKQSDSGSIQSRKDVAHAERIECKGRGSRSVLWEQEVQTQPGRGSQDAQVRWAVEPAVGRVAHGIPRRVDRLRGLGNAIVPQIAMRIGQTIKQVEAET
jgi:DNA (cytosine-5)-methyltransferase 1